MTSPIIILGSGHAGYSVAREFRKHDTETPLLIITEQNGDFYSKPKLSAALAQSQNPDSLVMTPQAKMAETLNATILAHTTVTKIDPDRRCVYTETQSYDYRDLILALGANPLQLPWAEHAMAVNHLSDYALFREKLAGVKRIAIVGAGLVGCEFSNDLHQAGFEIDLITLADRALDQLMPEAVGKHAISAFEKAGICCHLNTAVNNITEDKQGYTLRCQDGKTLQADLVLSAVGLKPNIALAKDAGIATQRGIVVNERLETSHPHIYALGDCAEHFDQVRMYIRPTTICAAALALTLTGNPTPVVYPAMPINLKTPYFPMTLCNPLPKGTWSFEQDGDNTRALCHDDNETLQGYALTGEYTKERMQLLKQVV